MLASESTESSSWDFSQVHDLLRSPTYGITSEPSRHNESIIPSLPEQHSKKISCHKASDWLSLPKSKSNHTQLGDFGSLWELLDKDSAPTSVTPTLVTTKPELEKAQSSLGGSRFSSAEDTAKDAPFSGLSNTRSTTFVSSNTLPIIDKRKPNVPNDTTTGYNSTPSFESQSFTILTRASGHNSLRKNTNVTFDVPRTPTKANATPDDSSDTPKAKRKPRSRGKGIRNDPFSSEGSAGVDSDASLVFDPPIHGKSKAFAFVPSQVGTPEVQNSQYDTPPSSYDEQEWTLNANIIKGLASGSPRVRSILYESSAERRVALMTRLLNEFPSYAKIVSQMGQPLPPASSGSVHSRPIHIFVDMSNILVGFHDAVKLSREIPLSNRIRRVHMSFANLALIMERGRQTAKRVLVGSDRLPCVDEAEVLGYETNILERVHKMKSITPRRNKSRKIPGSPYQEKSSGPEMVAASTERWVEQGVDEILHLKILESLLDTDKPATIVLATGDAAVAEFSGGFMRMVERALQRGWIVELVSFSQGTSNAYRKREFRNQWGNQFKLVELDSYVEELFE